MTTKVFGKLVAVAGAIVAIAAVFVSIKLNPPSAIKAQALDQERLQGLQQMDFAVKAYYREHKTLPDSLGVIENKDGLSAQSTWADPVTRVPYEYGAISTTTYRLCADFSADTKIGEDRYFSAFRSHHKGHDCFQEDINAQ